MSEDDTAAILRAIEENRGVVADQQRRIEAALNDLRKESLEAREAAHAREEACRAVIHARIGGVERTVERMLGRQEGAPGKTAAGIKTREAGLWKDHKQTLLIILLAGAAIGDKILEPLVQAVMAAMAP